MKSVMRPGFHVEIVTPKKVLLNGLWLGPRTAKTVIVWVHGLGSTMFSKLSVADQLIDKNTAVLAFNNRGHDKVAVVSTTTGKRIRAGAVHEVFADSADDIQGAVDCARRAGARRIYLAGHSTGCQKSIYYASKKPRGVRGVMILAPMSDYAAERMAQGPRALKKAEKIARAYVRRGADHEVLPEKVWPWPWIADAQRFLSLYSGKSTEELFPYWDAKRIPFALRRVKLPLLVVLAERDEFADRPAMKIQDWFAEQIKVGDEILIVPNAPHGFKGSERRLAREMHAFIAAH